MWVNAGYGGSLPWLTRMKIALGAAKGLNFLHQEVKPVIYRDFKTSNILLDLVNLNHLFTLLSFLIESYSPNKKISGLHCEALRFRISN